MNTRIIEIGLVCYPESQQAAVLGLTDLLLTGARIAAKCRKASGSDGSELRVSHWQLDRAGTAPTRTFASIPQSADPPTVLIAPPSLVAPIAARAATPWLDWLREHHANGAVLGSVCVGAFLLGETGLLAGRTVTTHWAHAERFRERFPQARLDPDRRVIDDGDIVTAGGGMSWTDLGLGLVARFLGPPVMIETARQLLLDPPGTEQHYYSVFSPRLTHGDTAVLKVQHWMQSNTAKEITLAMLARKAGLEERTLLRRFQKATGMTTTAYTQRLRIGKACELLQFGTRAIDDVAREVGYRDPSAFRKLFVRITGTPPGDFRRRFAQRGRLALPR